ncbi:MAG: ATP-binding protein [Ignavibacteriota bacterium]|nr:ATP-binding protein [Ignavibacteriales bacterium]MBL1124006.1 ATP-binding protein [Ignavibacteriota bacterium]MCC7094331.1 ATP-binding protein [Ignavibacteriaceae bacterium]MCE7857260.1 ATP-binding protein [Ignavibacteria bacterium CHB3]MEB2297981.1 ATP-binding protein [Ignavibacteria bacterium]
MLIKRLLYNEIKDHLRAKEISIIIGPRQVGKTTLMLELLNSLKDTGEKALFLNLDYENDKRFFENQDLLLSKIKLEIGNDGYVFIDEIQRKENAGIFIKGIYDLHLPYKFILSGSGSLELKEKIQESLVGRKRLFELLPVTFKEFVNYKTEYRYEDKLDDYFNLENQETEMLLNEYLSFGGYPRIVTENNLEEKKKIIDEIYRSYIEKDIVSLLNIDRPDAFSLLIKILASQTGKLLNYSKLATAIGISTITLKKYLWYAEKTYVIQTIGPFIGNSLKELTKSRTAYFYDYGLRNFANNSFMLLQNQNELGFVFQNFIKNLINEHLLWKNWTINFWRTTDKAEVDFVINKGSEVIPIEVKYSAIRNNTIKRALRSFIERYSPKQAFVINMNYSDQTIINETKVIFIPFYKLLTSTD